MSGPRPSTHEHGKPGSRLTLHTWRDAASVRRRRADMRINMTEGAPTVEMEREQSEFSENAMRYQASLRFVDSKISGMLRAIKGTG